MTFPSGDTENVEYQIKLDAILALQRLAELTNATKNFDTQMQAATAQVKNFASQWGMSFQQAKGTLAGLDKEISGTTESSVVFGGRGQEAWNKVGTAAESAGKKTQQGAQTMVGGINLVKTALHILVASGIFAVINAFQQMFAMAIKGLRELETATYNLVNAERVLSEQGVAITPEGLDETIRKLMEIDPLLSKIQATESVSRVASLVAPAIGFGQKEIRDLSQAIAVLAVKNKGLGKSFEEVESMISNAFLSGRVSMGINQLGVKITDQIVKDEALRMGLVKTGDEFDNLTGKMESNIKARAMLSVLTQTTNEELAHLPEFFKTADAQFTITQARLQDLLTMVGKFSGPALVETFDFISKALAGWIIILEKLKPVIESVVATFAAGLGFIKGLLAANGSSLEEYMEEVMATAKKAGDDARAYFQDFADGADTATAAGQEFASSVDNISKASEEAKEKVADLAKEMQDNLADIERQYSQKRQDIATNYSDKIADINKKSRDKDADALTDYNNKVADIDKASSEKKSKIQQDYRQKEIDREREYQNKLNELRAKFLFDLEDALRERDARAVLRLIRQYQTEKKFLEDKNKMEQQQNKAELQQKLQDAEIEKQQKMDAARKEFEDKLKENALARQRELEEAATWKRRELRDAATWHQRQLEEQRIYLQRKLRDLADAIAKEYQLMDAGARSILRLMQSYYTLAGGFGSTTTNPLSGGTSNTSTFPVYTNQQSGIGSGLYNPYDIRSRGGFAEGGTLLATRPTTVTFGETPEIATFTPITRMGQNLNDLVVSGGQGKGSGKANVVLTLSPDLRAEIVENSLETMAIHVERLVRND